MILYNPLSKNNKNHKLYLLINKIVVIKINYHRKFYYPLKIKGYQIILKSLIIILLHNMRILSKVIMTIIYMDRILNKIILINLNHNNKKK